MINKELKKEGLRSIEEFEKAWDEFFKDKPEPESDEDDKRDQEEFYKWYNYVRKQSDTGKTPAEMYKEVYNKEPPQNFPISSIEPSRMMNFDWDEYYAEDNEEDEAEDEMYKEVSEIADYIFENGVWQNSKEELKEMSRRDSSKHMFRLGFFMHSKYMGEQMKSLSRELEDMSEEDVQNLISKFKENKKDK